MKINKRKILLFCAISLVMVGFLYMYFLNQNTIEESVNIDLWKSVDDFKYGLSQIVNLEYLEYYENTELCKFDEQKRTIILRMDDIAAWQYRDSSKVLVDEILYRDLSVTIGVIPNNLETDRKVVNWLKSIRKDDRIEIALHGFDHSENEFKNLSEEEAALKIIDGKDIIKNVLRVTPITFIPPYNEYSEGTLSALDGDFKLFSAKEDEYDVTSNLISIGYTARTFEFVTNDFVPIEKVVQDCRESLDNTGLCVVMVHPQDYLIVDGKDEFDEVKLSDYYGMLDELEALDAEFKTFKDVISCESGI